MKVELKDNTLTIFLEGRLDSNNAGEIESRIIEAVSKNSAASKIQIDVEKLDYISSAGLRVLLKIRKQVKKPLPVLNASNELYEIFNVTGFTELLDVHKKLREVSIEGCELIGEGANGKVYRLTKDEIIKVFKYGATLDSIEAEREASRKAFLLGVPCAIAFDTVKCGDSYGTIYEMLNAGTLSERIMADHERLPEFAKASALLLKRLHEIEVPEGQMPRASRLLHNTIDKLNGIFTPDEIEKMHAIYNTIPEENHFVHNDYHPKNIMESNGDLMLIDLGDAGMGNPIIDLIHDYFVFNLVGRVSGLYKVSDDDIGFIGITYRDMREFWKIFIETYCGGNVEKTERLQKKLEPLSLLMYMSTALAHPLMSEEGRKAYIEKMRNLVLSRYDELVNYKW
ncbi:MAG: anti-sigma factor antagonist [Synergistaceae bacterium]|nr:anti-sigma factor antagonist [Synergistaceae bacterium]